MEAIKLRDTGGVELSSVEPPPSGVRLWRAQVLGTLGAGCRTFWQSGALCVSVAAVLSSISALLVKLTGGRIPIFEIMAFRSGLSFTACWLGAHQAGIKPLCGQREHWLLLLGRGSFGAAAMTTYYMSLTFLPLGDAVTLFFLNPAVTALVAWAVLKEPLGLLRALGVVLSMVGLVVLSQPPFLFQASETAWDHTRVVGTLFGLISAFSAAGAFICIRMIGKSEPALVTNFYFDTCAFMSSSIPLAAGLPHKAVLPSVTDLCLLFGIAVASCWAQIFVGRGFQLLAAAKASALNFMQVVYSYLFGLLVLHETLTLWGMVGSAAVATGVLLVNMRQKEQPQPVVVLQQGKEEAGGQGGDRKDGLPHSGDVELGTSDQQAGGQHQRQDSGRTACGQRQDSIGKSSAPGEQPGVDRLPLQQQQQDTGMHGGCQATEHETAPLLSKVMPP